MTNRPNCPNTTDEDAECVDPDCAYCKIARAEEPRPAPPKES
jgi:hypothetical protein